MRHPPLQLSQVFQVLGVHLFEHLCWVNLADRAQPRYQFLWLHHFALSSFLELGVPVEIELWRRVFDQRVCRRFRRGNGLLLLELRRDR